MEALQNFYKKFLKLKSIRKYDQIIFSPSRLGPLYVYITKLKLEIDSGQLFSVFTGPSYKMRFKKCQNKARTNQKHKSSFLRYSNKQRCFILTRLLILSARAKLCFTRPFLPIKSHITTRYTRPFQQTSIEILHLLYN